MTPNRSIHHVQLLDVPPEVAWDRISDHANTDTWVKAVKVRLLHPGDPAPNGIGALRVVAFPSQPLWPAIREQVLTFEPPFRLTYSIVAGMPGIRGHLGTLSLEPRGPSQSVFTWHIDFEFQMWHPMGWFSGPFTRNFGGTVREAMEELARQLKP